MACPTYFISFAALTISNNVKAMYQCLNYIFNV